MTSIVLNPETVSAQVFTILVQGAPQGLLSISAEGHEEGVQQIHVQALDLHSQTPVFEIVGEPTAAIGYFPYKAQGSFDIPNPDIQKIEIRTNSGVKSIPVTHLTDDNAGTNLPDVLTSNNSSQVVGIAAGSTSLDTAFSKAVSLLRQKVPGNVSAEVVESGFVAAGSPVGIAYTYVALRQK